MHQTAMNNCQRFFSTYAGSFNLDKSTKVVEIGSQDVNGSLRSVCPQAFQYIGVDFVNGKGVDIILTDPYTLPFETESVDIVISSSCFEHSEMFWLVYLEIMRILKPSGLFYLNAPSNGPFHRYPVDCWRFYPDSGTALVTWAKRNSIPAALLESYISNQLEDNWNDFVAIFLKDERFVEIFPRRIIDRHKDFRNGTKHGTKDFLNYSPQPEDLVKLEVIKKIALNEVKIS